MDANDKRTRSQLTLPDNILQIPSRSPLKDARIALRNNLVYDDENQDTDDEILLSPKKTFPKRSASPTASNEIFAERQHKRLKHDIDSLRDAENVEAKPTHSRHASEPQARQLSPRDFPSKSATAAASRAQSVPLAANAVPRIDFLEMLSSPRRPLSRSRSPIKDGLQILQLPNANEAPLVVAQDPSLSSISEVPMTTPSVERPSFMDEPMSPLSSIEDSPPPTTPPEIVPDAVVAPLSIQVEPQPPTAGPSRLPRPHGTILPRLQASSKLRVMETKQHPESSKPKNAFSVLMGKPRSHQPPSAKATGKQKASHSHSQHQTVAAIFTAHDSTFAFKSKDSRLGPKSMKSKMRPREKPKDVAMPVPLPLSLDDSTEISLSDIPPEQQNSSAMEVEDTTAVPAEPVVEAGQKDSAEDKIVAPGPLDNELSDPGDLHLAAPQPAEVPFSSVQDVEVITGPSPVRSLSNVQAGPSNVLRKTSARRAPSSRTASQAPSRTTRSVSLKRPAEDAVASEKAPKRPMLDAANPDIPKASIEPPAAVLTGFARPTKASLARLSLTKTPQRPPPLKAHTTPSPLKLPRSLSSFDIRAGPSSLSTLTNALEKLKMPAPSRPSTSLGFNPDDTGSSATTDDDSALVRTAPGRQRKPLGRAATSSEVDYFTSGGSSTLFSAKPPSTQGAYRAGAGALMGTGRAKLASKVSKNPGLPSVIGSPVKGGRPAEDTAIFAEPSDPVSNGTDPKRAVRFDEQDEMDTSELSVEGGSTREAWKQHASRRVSLASHALTQSLSALPSKPPSTAATPMGPPATPPRREGLRSSSSNYPSTSSSGPPNRPILSHGSGPKSAPAKLKNEEPALTILKECKVFVDLKSPNGEDVGDLFVEMLKGLGARVMTTIGRTCTHIVYRNGLTSTTNRYRSLDDPKPLVVGMSWVVACAEAKAKVDEQEHLVELEEADPHKSMKRRKSMIPKLVQSSRDAISASLDAPDGDLDGDTSMSDANSSINEGALPPLERARLRQSQMIGKN